MELLLMALVLLLLLLVLLVLLVLLFLPVLLSCQAQAASVSEVCEQYVDVLVLPASAVEAGADESVLRARWREELANRRQLGSYLSTLSDDLHEDRQALDKVVSSFRCDAVRGRVVASGHVCLRVSLCPCASVSLCASVSVCLFVPLCVCV
jgi:hypothetical protein